MTSHAPNTLLAALSKLEQARDKNGDKLKKHARTYQRFSVRSDAIIDRLDNSNANTNPMDIMIRDVTLNGIGFLCNHGLDIDTTWRVGFKNQNQIVGTQNIVIRHCKRIDQNGVFLLGGMFIIEPVIMASLGVDLHAAIIPHGDDVIDSSFVDPSEVA